MYMQRNNKLAQQQQTLTYTGARRHDNENLLFTDV